MLEYIMLIILILATIIGIVTVLLVKNQKNQETTKEIDYKTFYILGITFLPMGIILTITTDNPGFIGIMGIGAVYLAISLANKNQWKNKV